MERILYLQIFIFCFFYELGFKFRYIDIELRF